MLSKKKFIIWMIVAIVATGVIVGVVVWLFNGGYASFMPPITATLPQDEDEYGEDEKSALNVSERFWTAIEQADEKVMREIADEKCVFVHIGATFNLDDEINAYTSGAFKPTSIVFNAKNVNVHGDTALVLTDCNYSVLLGGMPTTHHFAVTEVYVREQEQFKLIQFSFTALVS